MNKIEIVDLLLEALDAHKPAELTFVAQTHGSAPRSAGAWMALFSDGSALGTVGGGSVENIAMADARGLLDAGQSCLVRYTIGGKKSDTGMICGGAVTLCHVLVDASLRDVLVQERRILAERGEGVLSFDLSVFGEGATDSTEHGEGSKRTVAGSVPASIVFPERQADIKAGISGERYLEPISPEGYTYIFGCGHVGRALVSTLAATGFAVVACDDRPEMIEEGLMPATVERRLVDYGRIGDFCSIGPRDFVVCATSGHKSDREVVVQALACRPTYLGCLGSAKKTAFVRAQLAEAGFSDEEIAQVHMPVGLHIQAETPEEIAVSIAAEMILHRRTALLPRIH